MSNLLDEMESDVTTPTIGNNSLKEILNHFNNHKIEKIKIDTKT